MIKKNSIPRIDAIAIFLLAILPLSLLTGTAVSEICSIIFIFIFIIKSFTEKNLLWYKNFYFIILNILWFFLILNLIFSKYPENTVLRSLGFIKYVVFIFSFAHYLKSIEILKKIFSIWTITLLIVSFDIYFEYIFGHNILGFYSKDPLRISSFLREELKIGHFVLGFFFICSGFFFERYKNVSNTFTIIGFIMILFFLSAIILTGERSNTIRAIIGLILFLLLSKKISFHKKKIISIFIVIIFFYFSFFQKVQERFDIYIIEPLRQGGLIQTYKGSQHAAHFYTAIEIFKSNLLFGIGNKNFRIECANEKYFNSSYAMTKARCASHPHQVYFELLSEHGIIGTALILGIIFYSVYRGLIIYKRNKNLIHLGSIIFIIISFIPFLPSGSFFTSFTATIFWLNFSIMVFFNINKNINNKK